MKKEYTIYLIRLLKYYPIVYSVEVLVLLSLYCFGIDVSNWIYCATGACLYSILICFVSSFVFQFCAWYRVLCFSSTAYIIFEWINVNIIKINNYLYISQVIIIFGMLSALIIFVHGKRTNKRHYKGSKKTD